MKKIAMLVLIHKNSEQLRKLIGQFEQDKFDFYIHVDKKYDFKNDDFPNNVFFLPNDLRIDITWGHMTMVDAMINLLKYSYLSKKDYMFYWFISGQDLVIKDSQEIYEELSTNKDLNYINFFDKKNTQKHLYRNQGYFPKFIVKRSFFYKVLRKLYGIVLNIIAKVLRKQYYFGSQWSVLNEHFIEYLFNSDKLLDSYKSYFGNKIVPDESFFQTIIMDSPYKDNLKNNLTYIDWSENASSPKTFKLDDYEEIISSNFFMARKFDIDVCGDIIDKIIEEVGSIG